MAYTYHAIRAFQLNNALETKEHAITNGKVEQESCAWARTFSISACKKIDIYGALGIRFFVLASMRFVMTNLSCYGFVIPKTLFRLRFYRLGRRLHLRRRQLKVECYLNEKEHKYLEKQVQASGLDKSAVIRKLIMNLEINPRPTNETHKTYCLIANIANNVNQIAHVANATGYVHMEQIETALYLAKKCWGHVKEIR